MKTALRKNKRNLTAVRLVLTATFCFVVGCCLMCGSSYSVAYAGEADAAVSSDEDATIAVSAQTVSPALTTAANDNPQSSSADGDASGSNTVQAASVDKESGADTSTDLVGSQTSTTVENNSTAYSNTVEATTSSAESVKPASAKRLPVSASKEASTVPGEDALPEGVYTILSDGAQHMAIDVSGASTNNGANVQLYEQNGTDAQHWSLTYDRDTASATYGMVKLINVASGKALDVTSAQANNGTNVQQYTANGTKAQWWKLVQDSGASGTSGYVLRSALSGNYVLDITSARFVNGSNVQIYASNGTKAQRFSFIALATEQADTWLASGVAALANAHATDLSDGTYVISASGAIRAVIDVSGGSTSNGGNVQVYASNNTTAQRWVVSTVKAFDGTVWRVIKNVGSGKVLDVAGAESASGTNVQQYVSNGTAAQHWAIVSNGNGTYTIWSALGHNLVIDLASGFTTDGTNAQVYTSNKTAAQKFVFTSANGTVVASNGQNVADGLYVISAKDGKVIDVPSASTANGVQLQTYSSNGTAAQVFSVNYDKSSGYYIISSVNSAATIDLDSGDPLPGGKVQQWAYADNDHNQMWVFQPSADAWKIVSAYTNLALTVSGGMLTTVSVANAPAWSLTKYVYSDGLYTITSLANQKVMDVPSGSLNSGQQIQTYDSNGTLAQKWYIRSTSSSGSYGAYTIQSMRSGKYLAVSNGKVVQQPYGQQSTWNLGFKPGVGLAFDEVATGKRLTANGTLTVSSASASPSQGWLLVATSYSFTGLYEFVPVTGTGLRLDVSGASTSDGANVQVYSSNGTDAQRWIISEEGSDSFVILSRNSGKALDITGGSSADDTNVQQYSANDTAAQFWNFKMGEYGIVITSQLGTALQLSGSAASGANVTASVYNHAEGQSWLLNEIAATSYVLAIDPGHGGGDSGATGNGLQEKNLTWKIASYLRECLVAQGVLVYITRTENELPSLAERVNRAVNNGAIAIISVHIDASESSSAHGASVLIPNDSSYRNNLHSDAVTLGNYVLSNIASLGISNRGNVVRNSTDGSRYPDGSISDYYGIVRNARNSGILGVIIEHGFITNSNDAAKFKSDSFLRQLAKADADGLIRFYGKGSGTTSSGSTSLGNVSVASSATPIMGASSTTVSQMARWFESKDKAYPGSVYSSKGAATITDFAQIVYEEAAAEGVRAEVVFAQAMLETGWLQFNGGLVSADKCNFAGLGATGNTSDASTDYGTGYTYANVSTGIRAQVQHLKAYASTAALNNTCVDQRFQYVSRGSAPTVELLSGKWASKTDYGESIVKLMNELLNV